MEKRVFGTLRDGRPIEEYTLRTAEAEVKIITLGGTITRFWVSGIDIVLGFDCLEDYLADDSYQGALIGRCGNRIKDARFTLNGKEYILAKNNGKNHLHGGLVGFDRRIWTVEHADSHRLVLSLLSRDGEEGYPGNLSVRVVYRLEGAALSIDYTAETDADTVCNLTNHAYFNLNGYGSGTVLAHTVTIAADRYTETDEELIPTGNRFSVAGTPCDFREPHTIGERLDGDFRGYDHNYWLVDAEPVEISGFRLPLVATASAGKLRLNVYTDQRCLQFYTANSLSGDHPRLKGGYKKMPYAAFCFESQEEPDSPSRGGAILRKGEVYRHRTVYEIKQI